MVSGARAWNGGEVGIYFLPAATAGRRHRQFGGTRVSSAERESTVKKKTRDDSGQFGLADTGRREFLGASLALTLAAGIPIETVAQDQEPPPLAPLDSLFPGFRQQRLQTNGAEINLVAGGSGPPLLLAHGFPQCLVMWHKVAPALARDFTVIVPDLRGYGDSSKPPTDEEHAPYSKRAVAQDLVEIMQQLGHRRFMVCAHDRGARVAHRMALDHPDAVQRLMLIDILPTLKLVRETDAEFAMTYWHWFFLSQPAPLPETLLGCNPDFFMSLLQRYAGPGTFTPEAVAYYRRTIADQATLHAACEDYRAAATIDLRHDEADLDRKIRCPLHTVWGSRNPVYRKHDVIGVWQERAQQNVTGRPMESGHFVPEELPAEMISEIRTFFANDVS